MPGRKAGENGRNGPDGTLMDRTCCRPRYSPVVISLVAGWLLAGRSARLRLEDARAAAETRVELARAALEEVFAASTTSSTLRSSARAAGQLAELTHCRQRQDRAPGSRRSSPTANATTRKRGQAEGAGRRYGSVSPTPSSRWRDNHRGEDCQFTEITAPASTNSSILSASACRNSRKNRGHAPRRDAGPVLAENTGGQPARLNQQ